MGHDSDRDMLIDIALSLCQNQGLEATAIDQVAAAAGVAAPEVTRYFATTDAVIMSIVDQLLEATAVALQRLPPTVLPAEALLIATTEMLAAIIEGRGVMAQERMLAMAHILTGSPNLRRQASIRRKHTLGRALAQRMGVAPEDPDVRRAVTRWSAVAGGAHLGQPGWPTADYDPHHDDQLSQHMAWRLADTYLHVTGDWPENAETWL